MSTDARQLFAEHGLRCTKQRLHLYEALARNREHPTADELFREVAQDLPGISLATVYNTLEAFCQVGLAQKLPGAGTNGSARFDAIRENHLHLRDQKTGDVADVPAQMSRDVLDRIPPHVLAELEDHLGFRISQVQIELIGEYARTETHANA